MTAKGQVHSFQTLSANNNMVKHCIVDEDDEETFSDDFLNQRNDIKPTKKNNYNSRNQLIGASKQENKNEKKGQAIVEQPTIPTRAQMLAEFGGTYILVLFGIGVIAQTVVSNKLGDPAGGFLQIALAWGIALALGVYYSADISGGHLNPAVTLTMAIFGRLKWYKVPFYVLGQLGGSFCAALTVYSVYGPSFKEIDNFDQSTAGIFATYPKGHLTTTSGFIQEMVGSALLIGGIFAIVDHDGHKGSKPIAIGLLITVISMSFGYQTGFCLNPARDIAPRILTAMGPWGYHVFVWQNSWFWVPLVAPFVGGILGSTIYHAFAHLSFQTKIRKSKTKNEDEIPIAHGADAC